MMRRYALGAQAALLTAIGVGMSAIALHPASAATFNQLEIADQSKFLVLAAPIGQTNTYKLLILEQLNDRRQCWQESGTQPTVVDPLLLNFDFTGICGRSTDSNGYSVRMAGEDLAGRYNLRLARKQNELVLIAFSLVEKNVEFIEIGRTRGLTDGFMKIYLDPGWRLTRRTYNGKPVGHIYLSTNTSLSELANRATPVEQPSSTPQLFPAPSSPPSEPPTQPVQPIQPEPSTVYTMPSTPMAPAAVPADQGTPGGQSAPMYEAPVSPAPSSVQPAESAPLPGQMPAPSQVPSQAPPSGGFVVPTVPIRQSAPNGVEMMPLPSAPSPQSRINSGSAIAGGTVPVPANTAAAGYRVVVDAISPLQQAQVKQLVPNAFRTTVNGQTVLQAGVFRDRATATTLQQKLRAQNLPARILSGAIAIPAPAASAGNVSGAIGALPAPTFATAGGFNLPEPPATALTQNAALWATYYYTHRSPSVAGGYPLLDMAGNALGPTLAHRDWCAAAVEGSVQVTEGQRILGTYNFAGRGEEAQVDCAPFYPTLRTLAKTNRVRFKPSNTPYGEGVNGFTLVPYRTIAVDKTQIPIGSVVYIPEARGTVVTLPSGQQAVHDGYFYAADAGSAVEGNHIDVFLGVATRNPFRFVQSRATATFNAYVVNDPQIQATLTAQHRLGSATAFVGR